MSPRHLASLFFENRASPLGLWAEQCGGAHRRLIATAYATALLGAVFAARGTALFSTFHTAAFACAAASLAAGGAAFVLVRRASRSPQPAM